MYHGLEDKLPEGFGSLMKAEIESLWVCFKNESALGWSIAAMVRDTDQDDFFDVGEVIGSSHENNARALVRRHNETVLHCMDFH